MNVFTRIGLYLLRKGLRTEGLSLDSEAYMAVADDLQLQYHSDRFNSDGLQELIEVRKQVCDEIAAHHRILHKLDALYIVSTKEASV